MADEKSLLKRLGASPKKLALIGVLSVVLIGVIYVQFGAALLGGGADATSGDSESEGPRRPRLGSTTNNANSNQEAMTETEEKAEFLLASVERRQWKTPPLSDVVRYDPFALPAAFPQPTGAGIVGIRTMEDGVYAADTDTSEIERADAVAAMQSKLQELQQRGVRVIIQGRKQAAAVIGDRTVHVGDDLDGFTVKAIQSDGVIVERKLD